MIDGARLVAALLAVLGAASGIPLALAQLDFAGVIDVFGVDAGDVRPALLAVAAIGGALTCVVVTVALVGAALCLSGSVAARTVLVAAAVAGFATALMLWLPAALAILAAAYLLDDTQRAEEETR
jgi:hypothetical protein